MVFVCFIIVVFVSVVVDDDVFCIWYCYNLNFVLYGQRRRYNIYVKGYMILKKHNMI